ncbi:MAG: class I mannose-6-phosphate isomerase [Kiritimatiellaeota bacterium]|nr:class I mannose-6-phosphate isomerase [Kiritimatiellota bacterium]
MQTPLYPLTFAPIYRDYLWGGDGIATLFRREGTPAPCAESWEISAHADGRSVVGEGALAGCDLRQLTRDYGTALTGTHCETETFPLLIKLIDAAEPLSVQVHPDDAAAQACGGEAKTEMWYVLKATDDAHLCAGLTADVHGPRQIHDAAVDKTLRRFLRIIPSRAGQSLFVPGGMVHAIGKGNLIFEVQQSSNTTYRLYDWDRVDADGRTRPLHLRQALDAINWRSPAMDFLRPVPMSPANAANRRSRLLRSDFFTLEAIDLAAPEPVTLDGTTFHALFVEKGAATLAWDGGTLPLPLGRSCLVPANLKHYALTPSVTSVRVLKVTL